MYPTGNLVVPNQCPELRIEKNDIVFKGNDVRWEKRTHNEAVTIANLFQQNGNSNGRDLITQEEIGLY